jgi:hypothetical protein
MAFPTSLSINSSVSNICKLSTISGQVIYEHENKKDRQKRDEKKIN